MDIVFIRTVLIYFDVSTKRQILRKVSMMMRVGGFLSLAAPRRPSAGSTGSSERRGQGGCSSVACRAAAVMLDTPDTTLADRDVADALGELANIVGGNFKALLPEPCRLSMPRTALRGDHPVAEPGLTQILQCRFRSTGEPLVVTVLQRSPASA